MGVDHAVTDFDTSDPRHVAFYDELPLWSAHAGALLLDHVPLRARRVLDLGCGAGFPMLELAERLGRDAFVVGLDSWSAALERAQAKCRAWSVPNAHPVRGDGALLPFRAGSFELVTSNLGVNNFADPERTLLECHRVLAPGGVLAVTTNVEGHFAEWYAAMAHVLESRSDAQALARLHAHVAHRGTAESLAARLRTCGFSVTATHARTVALRFRNGQAVLEHHFMRLGFVGGWREVAGVDADAVLEATVARLDADSKRVGEVSLTVPLVLVLAERG